MMLPSSSLRRKQMREKEKEREREGAEKKCPALLL